MTMPSPPARSSRRRSARSSLAEALRLHPRAGRGRSDLPRDWQDAPNPIRFDVWTGRSLYDAGRELAATPRPDLPDAPARPVRRLRENQDAIRRNYLDGVAAEDDGQAITPAAEAAESPSPNMMGNMVPISNTASPVAEGIASCNKLANR